MIKNRRSGLLFAAAALLAGCSVFASPNFPDESDASADMSVDVEPDRTDATRDQNNTTTQDTDPDQNIEWWDDNFSSRSTITLDGTGREWTVRIVIPTDVIPRSEHATDAQDLRFVQANVLLAHTIERVGENAIGAWVHVPDVTQPIQMYWGNADAANVTAHEETWSVYEAAFNFETLQADGRQPPSLDQENDTPVVFIDDDFSRYAEFAASQLFYNTENLNLNLATRPVLVVESRFRLHDLSSARIVGREGLCNGWRFGIGNEQIRSVVDSTDDNCDDHAFHNFFGGDPVDNFWHVALIIYDIDRREVVQYLDGVEIRKGDIDEIRSRIDFPAQLAFGQDEEPLHADIDLVFFSRERPTEAEAQMRYLSLTGKLATFGPVERR